MSVIASAAGTRIDCDNCAEHAASRDLTAEQLRTATGFVRPAGQSMDFCPRCAENLLGVAADPKT